MISKALRMFAFGQKRASTECPFRSDFRTLAKIGWLPKRAHLKSDEMVRYFGS